MRIKLLIANDAIKDGWEEVHFFDKPSLRSARFAAEEMVRKFNAILQRGELPRRLLLVEEFPMTMEEAQKLASEWRDLHEESAECHAAVERLQRGGFESLLS